MNSAARLIFSESRYCHITPFLRRLHRLKAQKRIDFKLAVLVYKSLNGSAPLYLADELTRPAGNPARRRLRSASSSTLDDRRTDCSTVGDRSFPVAGPQVWSTLRLFRNRLKTHLFSSSFPQLFV